jgi:hypothetical protein
LLCESYCNLFSARTPQGTTEITPLPLSPPSDFRLPLFLRRQCKPLTLWNFNPLEQFTRFSLPPARIDRSCAAAAAVVFRREFVSLRSVRRPSCTTVCPKCKKGSSQLKPSSRPKHSTADSGSVTWRRPKALWPRRSVRRCCCSPTTGFKGAGR